MGGHVPNDRLDGTWQPSNIRGTCMKVAITKKCPLPFCPAGFLSPRVFPPTIGRLSGRRSGDGWTIYFACPGRPHEKPNGPRCRRPRPLLQLLGSTGCRQPCHDLQAPPPCCLLRLRLEPSLHVTTFISLALSPLFPFPFALLSPSLPDISILESFLMGFLLFFYWNLGFRLE